MAYKKISFNNQKQGTKYVIDFVGHRIILIRYLLLCNALATRYCIVAHSALQRGVGMLGILSTNSPNLVEREPVTRRTKGQTTIYQNVWESGNLTQLLSPEMPFFSSFYSNSHGDSAFELPNLSISGWDLAFPWQLPSYVELYVDCLYLSISPIISLSFYNSWHEGDLEQYQPQHDEHQHCFCLAPFATTYQI